MHFLFPLFFLSLTVFAYNLPKCHKHFEDNPLQCNGKRKNKQKGNLMEIRKTCDENKQKSEGYRSVERVIGYGRKGEG